MGIQVHYFGDQVDWAVLEIDGDSVLESEVAEVEREALERAGVELVEHTDRYDLP